MRCFNCEVEFDDETEARFAFDQDYCENCFSNLFTYCSRCDEVIYRDNANYNSDGDPHCLDCWGDDVDEDAPDNPEVYQSDRDYIIRLSRAWLEGKNEYKRLISINKKDFLLEKIREKTGFVDSPLYLFGLKDREEYHISASPNIIEAVREFHIPAVIIEGIGCNRLGVSYTLRKENQKLIIDLIKHITSVKEVVPA